MKTVAILYVGTLPEVQLEIGPDRYLTAVRQGKPVAVTEKLAEEMLARGDWIEAKQTRGEPPTTT